MDDALLRESLVSEMRRNGSLADAAVARAFQTVPRHRFVPEASLSEAYEDRAISIKSEGAETLASISQPSMLGRMLELAAIAPGNRVLEIGTGSGYNAALVAELAGPRGLVVSIDVDADLIARARSMLHECGYENVRVVHADGHAGFAPDAPYDRIVISARAGDIAPAWWEQLKEDGRIVVPLDIGLGAEYAVGFVREGNELHSIGVVHCLFVPLRGEEQFASARYAGRPREVRSIMAVRTNDARPERFAHADVVAARPNTTFAVSWA